MPPLPSHEQWLIKVRRCSMEIFSFLFCLHLAHRSHFRRRQRKVLKALSGCVNIILTFPFKANVDFKSSATAIRPLSRHSYSARFFCGKDSKFSWINIHFIEWKTTMGAAMEAASNGGCEEGKKFEIVIKSSVGFNVLCGGSSGRNWAHK